MLESFTTWFCLKECVFKLVKPICMFVLPIFGFVIIHYFVWNSHLSIHTHTHLYLSVTFIHITLTFTSTLTITSHTHTHSVAPVLLRPVTVCSFWLHLDCGPLSAHPGCYWWRSGRQTSHTQPWGRKAQCVCVSEWLTAWVSEYHHKKV